jgi:hypothetical protein
MPAIPAVMALPFAAGARRFARWQRALALGTGGLSLGVGIYLAMRVGGSLA